MTEPTPSWDAAADLGMTEEQLAVYAAVVGSGQATSDSLALNPEVTRRELNRDEVESALGTLQELALVVSVPGLPRTYRAQDPRPSIGSRADGLERRALKVRELLVELSATYRNRAVLSGRELVEVISDVGTAISRSHQLLSEATTSVRAMERGPYYDYPSQNPAGVAVEEELLNSGVSVRVIYPQEELPERGPEVMTWVEKGEEARLSQSVPVRAFVVDSRVALVAGRRNSPLVDPLAVVYPGPLLDCVIETFERTWERAVPLESGDQPDDETDYAEVARLLAAGLTDSAIARHLDVSPRTTQRRIADLFEYLGAGTRFQAGILARERGLL